MKNETTMNLTNLAANGTRLDLALAEVQGKLKKLPTRGPRRGEIWAAGRQTQGNALGGVRGADKATGVATGKGQGGTLTPAAGLGGTGVTDLNATKARYARVKAAEHREAAREAAARCLAKREADSFDALDELLASL